MIKMDGAELLFSILLALMALLLCYLYYKATEGFSLKTRLFPAIVTLIGGALFVLMIRLLLV